jgi:hypothetical protein
MQLSFQLAVDLAHARLDLSVPVHPMKTLFGEPARGTALVQNLPHQSTKRWVIRRKAAAVAAVRGGDMRTEEARRVYQLSAEEFLSWRRALEIHGLAGLRSTRMQQYRSARSAQAAPAASPKRRVEPKPLRQPTPSEVS